MRFFLLKTSLLKKLGILALSFLLYACSSYNKDLSLNLDVLYAQGLHNFHNGDFFKAKELLGKITEEYPYREEAIEAQILLIWIAYLEDNYVDAEVNIDAFLKYYVYNDYTMWVNYMNGLVAYSQIGNVDRDQQLGKFALVSFTTLMQSYPKSDLSKDARYKIQVIKHQLANKELRVATYYLKNTNYISAISRLNNIIVNYSDTAFVEEAMYRLAYIWLLLDVEEEAFRVVSTLGYNYPSSEWYKLATDLLFAHTDYKQGSELKRNTLQ